MPIVFVSAHEDPVMRANALRAGAIAFLKKPFDNSTLLDALNRSTQIASLEDAHAATVDNRHIPATIRPGAAGSVRGRQVPDGIVGSRLPASKKCWRESIVSVRPTQRY